MSLTHQGRMPPPTADPAGTRYKIAFDHNRRIIRAALFGFWSTEDATAFCTQLNRFLDASRDQFGLSRTLVDRRECPVQAGEVTQILTANSLRLQPVDRLAVVVGSMLADMQFKRALTHECIRIFQVLREAELWLDEA